MPAQGRGANLPVPRKPNPAPTYHPAPALSLRAPISQHPFAPALRTNQQHVAAAQRALPAQPVPHIPRLANPTPAQTHAALSLIQHHAQQVLGAHPTAQSVAAYTRELHTDPRQADLLASARHYEAHAHAFALEDAKQPQLTAESNLAAKFEKEGIGPGDARQLASTRVNYGISAANTQRAAIEKRAQEQASSGIKIGLPGATINLSKAAAVLASLHIAPKSLGIVGKLANEAIDLPAQTFLSSAQLGSATRSAIEGKPAAIEGLGKGVLHQIEHPIQSVKEAPLATGLLFAGGEGALASVLGRAARAGVLGERAAGLASTVRAPLRLYGERPTMGPKEQSGISPAPAEALAVERRFNRDPLRKQGQVAYDKLLESKLIPERYRQADANQATGWRFERHTAGGVLKPGRLDRNVAGVERARRHIVKNTVKRMVALQPKVGHEAVGLIHQGILRERHLVPDLHKELARLKAVDLEGHTRPQLRQHALNVEQVEGLLHNKEFIDNPAEAFKTVKRVQKLQRPLEAILVHGGKLNADSLRAKLFPYAQAHMRAHYNSEPGVHPVVDQLAAGAREVKAAQLGVQRALGRREGAAPPSSIKPITGWHTAVHEARARLAKAQERQDAMAAHLHNLKQNGVVDSTGTFQHRLEGANGETLTNEAIKAHMAEHGVSDVGYLSHKGDVGYDSSYYQSTGRYPRTEKHARTGSAYEKGIADHSYGALSGTLARQASEAAQIEGRAHMLSQIALGPEGGRLFGTQQEAAGHARNSINPLPGEHTGMGKLVPIHMGAENYVPNAGELHDLNGTLEQFNLPKLSSAVGKANGKWGLVPESVAARLAAHERATSAKTNVGRGFQAYQQGFRRAKLNTSSRHVLGVIQEQGIRLAAEGVLPAHTFGAGGLRINERLGIAGKTVGGRAGRLGAKAAQEIARQAELDTHGNLLDSASPLGARSRQLEGVLGQHGGQVTAQWANDITRKGRAWTGEGFFANTARGADNVAHSTVGKKLLLPWHAWQFAIEGSLRKVEGATHNALLGKALKETGFVDSYKSALKLTDEGMHDLVSKGLTPNKADAIARAVDETMGNWTHLTPTVRFAVANVTPFGLWWLNSMRWLYRMPVTHPVKTGILAALYHATAQERNAKGQGYGAKHPVPGFLQGGIGTNLPVLGKGSIEPTYYSPGGTLGHEAGHTFAEQFFPALSSLVSAAKGENPLTGAKLTDKEKADLGPVSILANVLAEVASGPVPFATQAQQALQAGGKPYGTANWITDILSKLGGPKQVKPGTERDLLQVLAKQAFPFRFAYDRGATAGGGQLGEAVPSSGPSSARPAGGVQSAIEARRAMLRQARSAPSPSVQAAIEARRKLLAGARR